MLGQLQGFESTEVIVLPGDCSYGCTYLITYNKLTDDVPDLVLSGASLVGGQDGTFPQISFKETLKYSPNIVFRPVDERFMFLADSGPQVQVTVNNVLGTCQGNCAYNFITSAPEVTSQSLSGAQLSIAINDVNTDNYALTNLKVKLGDQICSNLAGSFASFTCDLPQNSDNTPTMEAGSYIAEVIVENVGIVSTANSVTALNFPFAVTSA